MKKTSLLSFVLAAIMLVGCNAQPVETTSSTTAQPPVTTEPHSHMESPDFPDAFDFSDTETMNMYFDMCEITDGIKVTVQTQSKRIVMRGDIMDQAFSLVVDLSGAAGNTSPEQIVTCAKLFWYCYPRMYFRFAHENTPTTVTLKIENFGYEIASAGGSEVHIHDMWLANNPIDFDCLTHEFSHIIQGGWNGAHVPSKGSDTYMIERFADYCRYLYSYQNGLYNDLTWTLQTINDEASYDKSVRFWVWLDYTYSTPEIDIMQRMASLIAKADRQYAAKHWEPEGTAWNTVFQGTGAEGKNLHQLWDEYAATKMSTLSSRSHRKGDLSALTREVNLRQALRDRYPTLDNYLKVN